jgi:cell fate regulator YaaT (PSP1 superfamily)
LDENSDQFKALYRHARPVDLEKWESVKALEVNTMYRARSIALQLKLRMKLSDVEYQGDGKKATFYYTADERVDFRELIKKLADEFKIRVEMRQIGLRQEASRLGGIGSCGRELCCSTWLTDFKIVSTSAARYQNLSLNPLKLSGQCGKLKCCLNYELDSYMDALRDIPDSNSRLESQKGWAGHRKTDIFKRMMWFAYTGEEGNAANNSDNWIALSVDRVKEIIAMNKAGEKPADLNDFSEVMPDEKPMDYADVVGQDSLTRMIDKKKKKKKKKGDKRINKPQGSGDSRGPNQQRAKPFKPERERSDQSSRGEQQGGQAPKTEQRPHDSQPRKHEQNRPPRSPVKPQSERNPQPSSSQVPPPQSKPPQQSQSTPPVVTPPKQEQKSDNPPMRVRQIPPRKNPNE